MDPAQNPFRPGAGLVPVEIAGRQADIDLLHQTLARAEHGNPARSIVFHGLRGVGKTVLLVQAEDAAEARGCIVKTLEASERTPIGKSLLPALGQTVRQLSLGRQALDVLAGAARLLRDLAGLLKVKIGDVTVSGDGTPARGPETVGDIALDLPALLLAIGQAAAAARRSVVLIIDELHVADFATLDALITGIHKCNQRQYPLVMIAAGLPTCLPLLAEAKSYSERLFDLRRVGPLDSAAAADAIRVPLERAGASIAPEALAEIGRQTAGYPFFLQVWGQAGWNRAAGPQITLTDILGASVEAEAQLDSGFFRMRFDRCTRKQRRYLRAMAETGQTAPRSAAVATALGQPITRLSSTRDALIRNGLIYSPEEGRIAFTVPLFDSFLIRSMGFELWEAPED